MNSGKSARFDGMGRVDSRQARPYIMVDRELIERLAPNELALYVVLLGYLISDERKTDRQCWPGHEELASACGWSVDTVQRTLKKLASYGLLTSTRRGKTQSNLYTLATVDADGEVRALAPSDTAPTRYHSRGDAASVRHGDAAKPPRSDAARMRYEEEEPEVEEGKDKNHLGSSIASLSPSVPRTPAQDEREVIMTKLAKQHGASVQEIHGAWLMASDPDFPGADEYRTHFRDWFEAWIKKPDEVAQDLANYRDKSEYDVRQAEFAARGNCDFHWQPHPCRGCAADAKAVNDETR